MSFGEKILKYKEDILKDLATLIQIESVSSNDTTKCTQALEFILKRASDLGLENKNILDVAGYAKYGSGEKNCCILTHLDVVDAPARGWKTPPFELTRKEGMLLGRGVVDNKGSAVIALYCLKVLKDENIDCKNEIRAIFGTSEEVGMEDMEIYLANEPLPMAGFVPDNKYGICRYEKGILQLEITSNLHAGTTLSEFKAGSAINCVPDSAYAIVDCNEYDEHQLYRLADAKEGDFEFLYTIDGMMIKSKGVSAHASEPEKGVNAATRLIDLISSHFSYDAIGNLLSFINFRISNETNGNSLGIKMRDSSSGELTVNVGTVEIRDNKVNATIDIRYPVKMDSRKILERIRHLTQLEGLSVKILNHSKPLNFPQDSPIVTVLQDAYSAVTGEKASTYSTGGGTYARAMENRAVAFGPCFEGVESNIHKVNEGVLENDYFKHAQICLEAVYKMSNM